MPDTAERHLVSLDTDESFINIITIVIVIDHGTTLHFAIS